MSQDNNYSRAPSSGGAEGRDSTDVCHVGFNVFPPVCDRRTLGTGLSYNDFFLAVFFGNLLLGIYTAFLGYIGAKTGLSTHLLARYSFGVKGSWLPPCCLAAHR